MLTRASRRGLAYTPPRNLYLRGYAPPRRWRRDSLVALAIAAAIALPAYFLIPIQTMLKGS